MPKSLTLKDLLLFALVLGVYAGLYIFNNNHQFFPTWMVPQSGFDLYMTFSPYWIWIYLAAYVLPVATFFYLAKFNLHLEYLRLFFILTIVTNIIFFFFPSTLIRPDVPMTGVDSITRLAFDILFATDKPFNCFPSTHVSTALIAAISLRSHPRKYAVFLAIALLISFSALAIGQHYLYDGLGGAAVALISLLINERLKGDFELKQWQTAEVSMAMSVILVSLGASLWI